MAEIVYPRCSLVTDNPVWLPYSASVENVGYVVNISPIQLLSLKSLMFSCLARRSDVIILDGEYFHNIHQSIVREQINAVSEARSHGCRFIVVGLIPDQIADGIRQSTILHLKEFSQFVPSIEQAVAMAAEMIKHKSAIESATIAMAIEDGKHTKTGEQDVRLSMGEGVVLTLEVMDRPAIPHPFDSNSAPQTLRFILGFSSTHVAVCGFSRQADMPITAGYVVAESALDLPKGWKTDWNSEALFLGAKIINNGTWTIAWPTPEMMAAPMIIGGKDFKINGKCVVQRTPFSLCLLVREEELADVE